MHGSISGSTAILTVSGNDADRDDEYPLTPGFITDEPDKIRQHRIFSAKFYFNYAMLIVNSFGLQNALERSAVDIGHFFARCHSSAVACATLIRDEGGPAGFLSYAPDSTCVMGSYAVLSLLKVISDFVPSPRASLLTSQLPLVATS